MVGQIIDFMVSEGLEVPHKDSTMENLTDALAGNRVRVLYKFGIPIGFFSWREFYKENKQYIYIENMCVKKKYRNAANFLSLRKFFRKAYPLMEFGYWHSQKVGMWKAYR